MKHKSLLVRIPPDIHDALTRLRTQRHVNTSAWVRAAIKTALEGEGMLIDMAAAQTVEAAPPVLERGSEQVIVTDSGRPATP